MHPTASTQLAILATCLTAITLALLVGGAAWAAKALARPARSAAITAALLGVSWLSVTGGLGLSSRLRQWGAHPSPIALLYLTALALIFFLGLSPLGKSLSNGLSIRELVLFQLVRIPLAFLLDDAASQGTCPFFMSFRAYNFDLATGLLAIVVGMWPTAPRWLVWGWNVVGTLLGLVLAGFFVASAPFFQMFGDGMVNDWIAFVPFVWVPTFVLASAMFGHFVLYRRLLARKP